MFWLIAIINSASAFEAIYPLSTTDYIIYSVVSLVLVCFGGLMSGLTVGLLSIDEMDLEIKLTHGTAIEQKQAKKILAVIENHHLLLVTLLLANSASMESLPLMLNKMVSEFIAIIISVTLVLVFGEVVPQALCTGPDQMKIAANLCLLVRVIMFLLWPLSYPIAKLLDCIFGHHEKAKKMRNEDLKALITLHHSFARRGEEELSGLVTGQINIIHGTIDLQGKTVKDFMIPLERVFSMSDEIVLDRRTLKMAVKQGYSRVPVYSGNNPNTSLGILLMKRLVIIDNGCKLKDSGIKLREPLYVEPSVPMLDLIAKFKGGKSHMGIISDGIKVYGIITLEDVFEQIIKSEILDEDDYDENKKKSTMSINMKRTVRRPGGFKKPYSAMHPLLDLDDSR